MSDYWDGPGGLIDTLFLKQGVQECEKRRRVYWGLLVQIVGGVWECDVSAAFHPLSSSLLSQKYMCVSFDRAQQSLT